MSKDQFGKLVNQLSAQVEDERAAEQAALRKQRLWRQIGRGCLWVVFVGLLTTGIVYRDAVNEGLQHLAFEKPTPAGSSERAQKVDAVMKAAQKHAEQVDAAGQ